MKIRRRTPLRARTQVTLSTVALIAALTAGTIASASSSAGARSDHHTDGVARLRGHFALLRAPAAASPPAALARAVAKAPASYGLRLADARQAASTGAWLVPGDGWLCIAAVLSEGLGMSCASTASAEGGHLSLIERASATGEEHIIGACPDGCTTVNALDQSSSRLASSPVTENTYTMSTRNAARTGIG